MCRIILQLALCFLNPYMFIYFFKYPEFYPTFRNNFSNLIGQS